MYRYIFVSNFNYGFHIPKKDGCEKCEQYEIKTKDMILSEDEKISYDNHIKEKIHMRRERNQYRSNNAAVLCFDLENVQELKLGHFSICRNIIYIL
jgi:hypothetical protein